MPDDSCGYPLVITDAGRSSSKRARQRDDCTVRAVAIVLDLPYDDAYDLLARAGRKCGKRFRLDDWIEVQPFARRESFPAVKGERRMNPVRFCEEHPTGRYICRVARHVFAVVDGVVHDDFQNRPDRCIYAAWAIQPVRAEKS